jgi:hypothetical protein
MFFILFHQCVTIYRCLLIVVILKTPCTISLYNLNMTYHFLGRGQTGCYVHHSKLAVQIPPFSLTVPICLIIKFHTPSSIQLTVKFKYFNSIGYHTYHYPMSFLEFSSPYWSSPPLTFSLPVSFLQCHILIQTAIQTIAHVSGLTNFVLSIKCINPTPNTVIKFKFNLTITHS